MENKNDIKNESPFDTSITEDISNEIMEIERNEFHDFLEINIDDVKIEVAKYLAERDKENEGMYELFGVDKKEIIKILGHNKVWDMFKNYQKKMIEEKQENIRNRFIIPFGKTKKEYEMMKKEVQEKINDLLEISRLRPDDCEYADEIRLQYIEKKKKLEFILKAPKNSVDIGKAKQYPVEHLLDFRMGFAVCPFHEEKTGSLKFYKKTNSTYCFGACHKHYDSIDIYMKLYNVTLTEAVKKLSI